MILSPKDCQQINSDLEMLIANGTFKYEFKGQRIQYLFERSEAVQSLGSPSNIEGCFGHL